MSETATALAVAEPEKMGRAISLRRTLKEQAEIRQVLKEFVQQQMVVDVDYGVIPGTKDKTLLKPGAEKLLDLFRCTPQFELVKCEEDFDLGFFNYIFRLRLLSRDANEIVAEGFGSANSREGRYRWRNAQPKCPQCGKDTIFASKHEPGWYCWAKKGGCGQKFGPQDARIASQPVGRVENDDVATLANTILKMAKKRALVDGAIALARCSDLFTQDVEDFDGQDVARAAPKQQARGSRAVEVREQVASRRGASAPATDSEPSPPSDDDEPAHDPQTGELFEPATVPSGQHKGKPLSQLTDAQLEWFALNAKDREFVRNCRAEISKRIGEPPMKDVVDRR